MSYNDLRKGRVSESGREYFVTIVTRNRVAWFEDFRRARTLIEQMSHAERTQQITWLAWVVMPDHLHGLIRLHHGDLSGTIKGFKARSARRINRSLGRTGAFWQPSFFDRALRADEDRRAVARYIVANPLRAGLVTWIGDYPHWDSVWL
jgi:REP element-mobilizing transposase RayT